MSESIYICSLVKFPKKKEGLALAEWMDTIKKYCCNEVNWKNIEGQKQIICALL